MATETNGVPAENGTAIDEKLDKKDSSHSDRRENFTPAVGLTTDGKQCFLHLKSWVSAWRITGYIAYRHLFDINALSRTTLCVYKVLETRPF
jgi:hypothetical protein